MMDGFAQAVAVVTVILFVNIIISGLWMAGEGCSMKPPLLQSDSAPK